MALQQLITYANTTSTANTQNNTIPQVRCACASLNDARHMYAWLSNTSNSLSLQDPDGTLCKNMIAS